MRRFPRILLAIVLLGAAGCAPSRPSASPSLPTTVPIASPTASPAAAVGGADSPTEPVPTSLPTQDIESALLTRVAPRLFASYPSPDSNWQAEVVIYECTAVDPEVPNGNSLEQLRLIRVVDASQRTVHSQLLYCGGLGAFGLEGLFWTEDSRYFYYTDAREGGPDGCGYWRRPLLRFDVLDGSMDEFGAGTISPDGTKIAAWNGDQLEVWELAGGQIGQTQIPLPGLNPGATAWSPGGESLVLLLSQGFCPHGETLLVRVPLPDLAPSILLSSEGPSFADVTWDTPNQVTLHDEQGTGWTYDLITKELVATAGS